MYLSVILALISVFSTVNTRLSLCPNNYFYNGVCAPCSECPLSGGLFVLEPCGGTKDTVCGANEFVYEIEADPQEDFASGYLTTQQPILSETPPPVDEPEENVPTVSSNSNNNKKRRVVIVPMPWYINACLIVAVVISCICVLVIVHQLYHHYKSKSVTGNLTFLTLKI